MTTGVVETISTVPIGTWTVVCDSNQAETPWGSVSWTAEEPAGTLILTEVRSSHDQGVWSDWETAENGVGLSATPDGRYLEIRVTLEIIAGDQSPLLHDLTVQSSEEDDFVGGCFIAAAAYGTPMAQEVRVLRQFRDTSLLPTSLGKALVELYYQVSPPMAEFITGHPSLKPVVRAALVPAVAISTIVVNTGPAEKVAMVGLPALVSVALAVWIMRRCRCPEYL